MTAIDGTIGHPFGLPVFTSPYIPPGTIYIVPTGWLARSYADAEHRLALEMIKHRMRQDLRRTLDAFAARYGITGW